MFSTPKGRRHFLDIDTDGNLSEKGTSWEMSA